MSNMNNIFKVLFNEKCFVVIEQYINFKGIWIRHSVFYFGTQKCSTNVVILFLSNEFFSV